MKAEQDRIQKHPKRRIGILIGAILAIAVLAFVFGNSLLSKQESAALSTSVMDAVEGLLRPIVELFTDGPVDDALLHKVIRKGAHFVEFAGLSALLTVILWLLCGTWRTHAMGYVLFISLLLGVVDEFIQSFTGRGTSVRDVMLDFGGTLIGILLAIGAIELISYLRRRRKTETENNKGGA